MTVSSNYSGLSTPGHLLLIHVILFTSYRSDSLAVGLLPRWSGSGNAVTRYSYERRVMHQKYRREGCWKAPGVIKDQMFIHA